MTIKQSDLTKYIEIQVKIVKSQNSEILDLMKLKVCIHEYMIKIKNIIAFTENIDGFLAFRNSIILEPETYSFEMWQILDGEKFVMTSFESL